MSKLSESMSIKQAKKEKKYNKAYTKKGNSDFKEQRSLDKYKGLTKTNP